MLGPYEILSLIGEGGMGEVYKGRDTRLERLVALKILPAHLATRPDLRKRFEREATTVANLQHPNICVLYDVGEQQLPAEDAAPAQPGASEPAGLPPPSKEQPGEPESGASRRTKNVHFLVMEYLEGVTLSDRLKKGPLPLDEVLRYAIEVSDALDKAHRAKVTHRDVKPANIMLTKEGSKLLDFGLAKLKLDILDATVPPSERPTVPGALTEHGTLLGTLQYMAPEQLECKDEKIDSRTDIFAFGTVVYELVTGKKAFPGESQASVIAGILERQPLPMTSLQPAGTIVPPALDRTVRRCLAKDPEDRWQTAHDLEQELRWIADVTLHPELAGSAPAPAPVPARTSRRQVLIGSAAALVLAALVGLGAWTLKPAPPQPVTRTVITLPPGQRLAALNLPAIAISPDGKNLVYVAVQINQSPDRQGGVASPGEPPLPRGRGSDSGSTQQLFLRPLDSQEAKPIAGTEGAVAPFFSPDGQWIGFFAGGKLKKVSVNGGAAVTLANAPSPGGASWSSQGTLALQPVQGSLQQVSQEGGTPQGLTPLGKGEIILRWPEYLPGGKAVLFAGSAGFTTGISAQIAVQPTGTGERKNLAQGTQPRYAASGHLLYAQSGTLMAAPFDARQLVLKGPAVPAVEGVAQSTATGAAQYSVSSTGTLVYLAGGVTGSQSRLVWVSRNGEEQLLPPAPHNYSYPRVSPDGRRVAVPIADQEAQIWIYDTSRDTLTRLTFEGNTNNLAAWSSDGRRIAIQSNRAGPPNIFWQASDGSGGAERLTTSDSTHAPSSFSPDSQLLAFIETTPETSRDIWVLRLADPSAGSGQARKAQPFLRTPYEETAPKFSPDGQWLAYSSDESGRREVYVQPYPGPGGKWQISTDGGQEPVWNPNGREMFYRSGSKMMAVDVNPSRDPSASLRAGREGAGAVPTAFSAGKPRMLFDGPYLPTIASFQYYDVSPDGQRFLMLKPVESQVSAPTQINVVLNWFEELKRRVPTGR
jgi:serine/threonine-protein kinase